MPQVIYTGENYQKPIQSGGRALQALSQFTQQRQQRKEAEKERSRKDRDALAKMMEIDPVYASHTALQTQMATELDSLKDVLIDMNKEMAGREPTAADYMRMQQEKARGMAKLNQLKALDTEVQQSASAMKMNPTKYDPVLYQEAMDEFIETSKRPDQGFLFPMIQNPENLYVGFKNAQIKGTGGREDQRGDFVASPQGGGYYPQSWVYPGKEKFPEERVQNDFLQSPASYDVQGWFDTRVPLAEQEQYLKRTGGDRVSAAELRFRERTAGTTYPPIPEELSKYPVKASTLEQRGTPTSYQGKEEAKTYVTSEDVQYVGGKKAFSRADVTGGMIATKGADGIRFAANAPVVSIPAGQLEFSADLELSDDARVWVRPNIAADGRIEFAVDTKETGMVNRIVDKISEMPLDVAKNKKFTIVQEPGGKKRYSYQERVPENLTASGDVSVVGPMLKTDYEGTFEKQYEEWFGGQEGSRTMDVNKVLRDNKDKNFVKRILDPTTVKPLDRGGGVSSTHSMEWGEADGKYYVYPTVVEQNGKLVDISDQDPFRYALKNGEYIKFNTAEEASEFSGDNGYKQYWYDKGYLKKEDNVSSESDDDDEFAQYKR